MNGDTSRRDVIVVGGGPAGSALACFLRSRGRDVLLFDGARFPRDKICGEAVSPPSWLLLETLGAADAVRAIGPHPLRGMRLTSPDGTVFHGDYPAESGPGFALRRLDLDAALQQPTELALDLGGGGIRRGDSRDDAGGQHDRTVTRVCAVAASRAW